MELNTLAIYFGILSGAVQLFLFIRWLYRRYRDDDRNRTFVRDMATNHLPHIYHALNQIASAQGLELEEPPQVQWTDFNGKRA